MKKILLSIVLILSLHVYGQEVDPYKFTSVVDLYEFPTVGATGNLDAQLPLYTINTRGFELPLALNYDQMGNSNVFYMGNQFGDAWVLNVMGTISREVGNERSVLSTNLTGEIRCGEKNIFEGNFSARRLRIGPYVPDEEYYQNNVTVKYRLTPDHYTFSFMGLSGKFTIYNDNGILKPQLLESSDFAKIEIVQPANWEVVNTIFIYDKNGYKYKFSSPSNVNQNNYQESLYLNQDLYLKNECKLVTTYSEHALAPPSGLGDGTGTQMRAGSLISRAIFADGKAFWRNLELTEIYDKENTLLVSYEYDSVGILNGDSANGWVNGLGMNQAYQKLFLKKINVIGQGTINFNNTIQPNGHNVADSFTNSLEIKDLKNNVVKKITFDFIKPKVQNIPYIKNYNDGSYGLMFQKKLLSGIKEYNNTTSPNFLHTTINYKTPSTSINNTNVVVDRYGFLTKTGYCQQHLSKDDYRADSYILQKIKYPTGGSVVYEFEPNTFSHSTGTGNFQDHNYDNHIYETLPLQPGTNNLTFSANQGDKVYVFYLGSSSPSLYNTVSGTLKHVPMIMSDYYIEEKRCRHESPSVILPASDNGKYTLKYSSGPIAASSVRVYRLKYNSTYSNFRYVEGSRISKIAYFNDNVNQTILNTPAGEATAEKLITIDYSDQTTANTSSGRVRLTYSNDIQMLPFNVIYGEVKTNIRGVGKKYEKYDFPNSYSWKQSIRTDIKESKNYNLSDELLSESNYNYTYNVPSVILTYATHTPKPFISSSTVMTKSYEGSDSTTSTISNIFSTANRQIISTTTEDNLGDVTKSEFDYGQKGSKMVNTEVRNYVNNNLTDQVQYTHDTTGNLTKSEFKTPEMSGYEVVGNINKYDAQGNLVNSVTPDGTSTCFIWGYNKTKLIAKLVNVTYTDFSANPDIQNIIVQATAYSNQAGSVYDEEILKDYLNGLRFSTPNAFVTTYTYKPMVGLSSITDENGKTTTYHYDIFNRLSTVKDNLGNILKEYQYSFTN